MEEGLLDAIQPDMLHMGFWQFHVLARDIEKSGVDTLIAPHNYNSAYLGLRADIQFGAATLRFVIAEDSTLDFELYKGVEYVFEDGKYAVPDSPGLAVSIDQDLYDRVYKQHETVIS
jgi:L-alanine-DL-glutamate epimerase-like enolase superfamily enzyme